MGGAVGHRCSVCAFTFPLRYEVCALCGNENLWSTYSAGPESDWEQQLSWRLRNREIEEEESRPKWDDLVPHNYDNEADLVGLNERLWVTHQALIDNGYLNLTEDTIVFLNGEFYELQGYDRSTKSWWIDTVVIDSSELTPEQIIGYSSEA